MDKHQYSARSLDNAVREFEREYGMTTEDFYARWVDGTSMEIPRFEQHVWASFHEDILRLTDGNDVERQTVTERVGRALVCQ
jgi:hypothetical protein